MVTMRSAITLALLLLATGSAAQENLRQKKSTAESGLKKGTSVAPDRSLAGDLTRKKEEREAVPALQYDQFRLRVELQVASKRHEQIESLTKIIRLAPDQRELPGLLFRLGELYWEESKFFFFEANRKDDEVITAINRGDQAAQERARAEKEHLLAKSRDYVRLAIDRYSEIVQKYKDYERTDEVLYFLGQNLMESGEERKALVAYKRLIDKYKKSKFYPDALLAFGEYYFNTSKAKRDLIEKALSYYKQAASFPENQVYAFALYKQGWCYFNLSDYQRAMDMFKAVVLYGEYAGASAVEKDAGKSGKGTLRGAQRLRARLRPLRLAAGSEDRIRQGRLQARRPVPDAQATGQPLL
jgi:TolA-binding protein